MNLLLGTCTFLWASGDRSRLSSRARDLIAATENDLYLSTVSAWEIALKHGLGTLILPQPPPILIPQARELLAVASLELDEESAILLGTLPSLHRDPFDRMLVCQAKRHKLTVLTPDKLIRQYDVDSEW